MLGISSHGFRKKKKKKKKKKLEKNQKEKRKKPKSKEKTGLDGNRLFHLKVYPTCSKERK
jgi:hypothetical protein